MTINDGFGDHSYDLIEQTLLEKERLIRIQAAERNDDPNLFEDLVQEGRIALWQVLAKRPDAPAAYLHAATGMRITEVLMRGKLTGMPSQRGKPSVDPLRRKDRDSLDDPSMLVEAAAPELLDVVEWAYHEGQILDALRSLPENHQHYVVLRFWGGWTPGEMAPVIGVKSTNQARMWTESIRPVLATMLSRLASAA